ncbi:MAG: transporter, partial [Firmicutes bacterium]|nr:transporter [Bacillota bacterium]
MVAIGTLHIVYLVMTLLIIIALLFKKEIVLPSVIGIFLMGLLFSGNPIKAVQVLYNALVVSGSEFLGIIVVIALVVSMSKTMATIGADELMIRPLKNAIKSNQVAFFIVGAVMLIASWFIWPSPAVALVGAMLLPFALKAGLPAIWAAVSMNIFGHGIGLSSDYFIQGAPSITAKAAGVNTIDIMKASIPLWLVMSIVTIAVAFIMFRRDMKANPQTAFEDIAIAESDNKVKITTFSYFMAVFTPLAFILDVVLMVLFKIVGGDATALVGGTAVLIMTIILIGKGDLMDSLDEIT